MEQVTQKQLTVVGIQQALDVSPYRGKGQTYFHCDPTLLNTIERASAAGYILRTSHTQAEWTEEGLQKARQEIPERDLTEPCAYPDNKKLFAAQIFTLNKDETHIYALYQWREIHTDQEGANYCLVDDKAFYFKLTNKVRFEHIHY